MKMRARAYSLTRCFWMPHFTFRPTATDHGPRTRDSTRCDDANEATADKRSCGGAAEGVWHFWPPPRLFKPTQPPPIPQSSTRYSPRLLTLMAECRHWLEMLRSEMDPPLRDEVVAEKFAAVPKNSTFREMRFRVHGREAIIRSISTRAVLPCGDAGRRTQ